MYFVITIHPCSESILYPSAHLAQALGPAPVQWSAQAYNKDKNQQDLLQGWLKEVVTYFEMKSDLGAQQNTWALKCS